MRNLENSDPVDVKYYSENWDYVEQGPKTTSSHPNFTLRILTGRFILPKTEAEKGFLMNSEHARETTLETDRKFFREKAHSHASPLMLRSDGHAHIHRNFHQSNAAFISSQTVK